MLSLTYRFMKFIGLNFFGRRIWSNIFLFAVKRAFRGFDECYAIEVLYVLCYFISAKLSKNTSFIVACYRGANMGKDCYIGYEVYLDVTHSDMITLEDHVHIANRCFLLCHQRDLSNYHIGDDYAKLGYNIRPIVLKKGCLLGTGSMIMPGVTIGEGAIVGAGSLVTKDIPAWTIAMGRPAKVIKVIPQ